MENFLIFFLKFIDIMFGLVFIGFVILLAIAYKRVKQEIMVLNKDELIKAILPGSITFLVTSFIFGLSGVGLILFGTEYIVLDFNVAIFMIIMGIFLVLIFSRVAFKETRPVISILRNKYVVVKDVLKDKDERWKTTGPYKDHRKRVKYYLYFKDYFCKYNREVSVSRELYRNAKIGEEFYLIFIKGFEKPLAYRCEKCETTEEILEKIIPIEELKDFIKIKEFKIEDEFDDEKREITKKECIKDYVKEKIFSMFLSFFILVFLIFFMFMILFEMEINKAVVILIILPILLFGYMLVINISTTYKVVNSIKHDKYSVKEDVIEAINERMDFKDTNELIKLKLKNTKKSLILKRKRISNAKIGDEVYLVFVKSETDPIGVYNKKSVNFDM